MTKKKALSPEQAAERIAELELEITALKRQAYIAERKRFDKLKAEYSDDHAALLAAGVAHEFNNILGAVDGHAEWALDSKDNKEMVEALEVIRMACERSSQITKSLRGMSQPREETKKVFSLAPLLKDVRKLAEGFVGSEAIAIECEEIQDHSVYGDANRLLDVILNLLKNAVEACAMAKVSVPQILLRCESSDEFVSLIVDDNGPGIPPSQIQLVFQPFFTSKGVMKEFATASTTSETAGGSGLGLYLSQRSVVEFGGDLQYVGPSKWGGASFQIRLPRI